MKFRLKHTCSARHIGSKIAFQFHEGPIKTVSLGLLADVRV